jgi:hypothetical protein
MHKYSRAVLALGFCFGAVAALAQGLSLDLGLDSVRTQSWVLGGAGLDFDFTSSRFYQSGQTAGNVSLVTTSRASTKYCDDTLGNWTQANNNVLCLTDKGALIEEARTNVALWCRDLTNAAWAKTNVTAALDQTGIDGGSNSASSILATAGNATALQAITLASSARFQSAFVKRITGSGTINMTTDGGATWTAVTVTSAWSRVTIPTQTLANPSVGFRIVTSGDKIAVDFAQNENSDSFATSPILTTTLAITRAADVVTVTNPPVFGSAYTLFGKGTPNAPTGYGTNQALLDVNDGTSNNRIDIRRSSGTGVATDIIVVGNVQQTSPASAGAWNAVTSGKLTMGLAAGDQALSFNGSAVTTSTTTPLFTPSGVSIGSRQGGTLQWNGYVERIALWPSTRLPNATLQSLTQ